MEIKMNRTNINTGEHLAKVNIVSIASVLCFDNL